MTTAGPNYGGTSAGNAVDGNTVAWATDSNATASDNNYATATAAAQTIQRLCISNFGFSLPAGATIQGFQVEVECKTLSSARTWDVVAISKNAPGGLGLSGNRNLAFTTTEAFVSNGGASDLWSTSGWTAADINSSNFGVVLASNTSWTDTFYVDSVRITITYSESLSVTPTTLEVVSSKFAPTIDLITNLTPTTLANTITLYEPTTGFGTGFFPGILELVTTKYAPTIGYGYTPGVLANTITFYEPVAQLITNLTPTTLALITAKFAPTIYVVLMNVLYFVLESRYQSTTQLHGRYNAYPILESKYTDNKQVGS